MEFLELTRLLVFLGTVAVFVQLDVVRKVYKYLRCLYYVRKLPVPAEPRWLTGHSSFIQPEAAFQFHCDYLSDPEKRLPGVFRYHLSQFLYMVNVFAPHTIEPMLAGSHPKLSIVAHLTSPVTGEGGVFFTNGEKWARKRRLVAPGFHKKVTQDYVSVYESVLDSLISDWSELLLNSTTKSGPKSQSRVSMNMASAKLSINVLVRCVMSYELSETETIDFKRATDVMARMVQERGTNAFLYPDSIYFRTEAGKECLKLCNIVHTVTDNVIASRRKQLLDDPDAGAPKKNIDFLDILLTARYEDGAAMDDKELREEVTIFLIAGMTSSVASQWLFYYLAANPDIQQRCREEACAVLCPDGGEPVLTEQSLNSLQYITQVIKEVLRIATPTPQIYRELEKDTMIGGYLIPSGTWVVLSIWALHHNPDIWKNPMTFNPSRFDPGGEASKAPPFSYVPFSGGSRNCIGKNVAFQLLRAEVVKILLRFKLSVPDDLLNLKQHLMLFIEPSKPIELLIEEVGDC
ncbi:taurochenodeoxycholic 6 alpha-hydroxylase-like [Sycon ciliatum]|uniref:taurochenodeoxycholic 6 alpha-hydroxylase-like n=1 Tax=Sycon ciliatum TaxID=27933 RepID=UPI0020AE4D4E|eukprot:scpid55893/ scgid35149/ Taurochenodeoxycholic 6 alpha-hydroxylase; CYPIVA21; Cytochrome P450 4A21